MKIKRLEVLGFKSFVNPTTVDFDAPIVGIVGPNGCGKSNVIDSIRWVMGEMSARSLRGRSMEDIIFNGSEKRAPLGMAQVSLTFSTEDGIAPADYAGFNEISVTRRLFRSGESEYLINKVPARLRDVVELFLGTGVGHKAYSIIEQGKIDFVITAKPEERRLLIEEAAGISKFKSRKEAALRKIEGTEQNLSRLKDIQREVTRQINSLDRQVKKAEKFKILKGEVRELELKLSSLQHQEMNLAITELKALFEEWSTRELASTTQLSSLEADLETNRLELSEKDAAYNALQEKVFEIQGRLQLLDAQQGFRRKESEGLEVARKKTEDEIVEFHARLENCKLEMQKQDETFALLEKEAQESILLLEETETSWKALDEQRTQLAQEINRLKEDRHQNLSQLQRLDTEQRLGEEKKISLQSQLSQVETELTEESQKIDSKKEIFTTKVSEKDATQNRYQSSHTEIEILKSSLAEKKARKEVYSQELKIRTEELVLRRSRLRSLMDLEKNFEGYDEGVRSILKRKKEEARDSGIFGVVADFIETAPQYEMAVSAALGEKLQYIIVRNHDDGVESINFLKTNSSGRSTFIPLELRDNLPDTFSYDQAGVVGPLSNFLRFRQGYEKIGQHLLRDTVLVNTLTDALTLWRSNDSHKTWITLDGEVVDSFGVVSGGTTGIQGKLLLEKKREISELRSLILDLEGEISLKEDTLSQAEGTLSGLMLELENLSQIYHQEDIQRANLENEVKNLEADLERSRDLLTKLEKSREQISGEIVATEEKLSSSSIARTEASQKVEERNLEITQKETLLETVQTEGRDVQEKLTSLRVHKAAYMEKKTVSLREKDRLQNLQETTLKEIDQKNAYIQEADQKKVGLLQEIEQGDVEVVSLRKQTEDLSIEQEEARLQCENLSGTIREKELQIKEARKENDSAKSHTGDLRVSLSKVETEFSHLEQQIFEKYAVVLAEVQFTPPAVTEPAEGEESLEPFDRTAESQRLTEWKLKMESMGDVNLGSIPEYEELQTRQTFLNQQVLDLETSISSLKKAIQKINQTTKQRFETTFELVNERFKTLFPRLFRGGRAEIKLVANEGDEMLNGGVELMVQPGGKKLSHLGLLSGGEKAMAAIAFIFSIFLVKPSPFCILDEVDAPLDDVNAERFHNLLSEMTPRTQFILITHNRRTMEKADMLYGVTMQEPGVSQLVSVRFSEALKMAS